MFYVRISKLSYFNYELFCHDSYFKRQSKIVSVYVVSNTFFCQITVSK